MLHIRFAEMFLSGPDGLDHKCHIGSHIPDGLTAFHIRQDILALISVYVIPVGAWYSRHSIDAEELIHNLEGSAVSTAPAGDHGSADLHMQITAAAVEKPLHEG